MTLNVIKFHWFNIEQRMFTTIEQRMFTTIEKRNLKTSLVIFNMQMHRRKVLFMKTSQTYFPRLRTFFFRGGGVEEMNHWRKSPELGRVHTSPEVYHKDSEVSLVYIWWNTGMQNLNLNVVLSDPPFKGTVSVILSDPPCKDRTARFTTVFFKP